MHNLSVDRDSREARLLDSLQAGKLGSDSASHIEWRKEGDRPFVRLL